MSLKRFIPLTAAAVFCAAMALIVCNSDNNNDKCAANPTATPGCPGYVDVDPPGENDIHTLTLTAGTGGTVAPNPKKTRYAQGESVTITATPSADYNFAGWSGDASGITNPLTFTMTENKSITATFTPKNPPPDNNTYTLTLTPSPGGTLSKNPNTETHPHGEQVTITARPDENYQFTSWSGDAAGNANPHTVSMTQNRTVTANFTYVEPQNPPGGDGPFNLTININPPEGGSAVPDPKIPEDGIGPVWGPYETGKRVTISYAENPGYQFDGWTGDGTGNFNRSVTMAANRTVTANFEQMSGPPPGGQKYSLNLDITTLAAKNSGKCAVTQPQGGLGLYDYDAGESITVTATGGAPYVFQGWREKDAAVDISSNAGYTFTINKNTDLIARFIDTTTPDAVKYCRWEGSSSNCWKIDPYSTDPTVTKSEAECLANKGEVVENCSDPANGVFCSYPATKDDPASCSWRPGTTAAAAEEACKKDKGTVVDSCPAQ